MEFDMRRGGGNGSARASPAAKHSTAGNRAAENLYRRAALENPGHQVKKAPPKKTGGMPRRPNFLTCYLCGQQFGKASLPIHQPQCYVKKLIEWERNDPDRRGPKPIHPDDMAARMPETEKPLHKMSEAEVQEYNDAQFQTFNDNMVKCENCGRTFFADRLVVHQRSCRPGASGGGSKPVQKSTVDRSVDPLRRNIAAVSAKGGGGGGGFSGNSSYELPDDDDAYAMTGVRPGARSPRGKQKDVAVLDPDEDEDYALHLAAEELSHSDTLASAPAPRTSPRPSQRPKPAAVDPSADLVPCPRCGRRFVPKKLDLHMKLCKGSTGIGGGAGSPTAHAAAASLPADNGLVPCQHCGRTFAPDRVEKHEGVCLNRGKAKPAAKKAPPVSPRPGAARAPAPQARPAAPAASAAPARSSGPKFCEECGTRFVSINPKFCQECGTRVPGQ
eukprot:TRINITY_DN21029_c0_g1_i1.p1 TRINITY_DN21029_c0_g1~~TRINITY_DN21029_c0_g1_i1.p1  ORF type:complete len:460 (+),score=117.13 TRINITY_DN21029_c0_g1_i1:49-1380(+)